MQKLNDCYVLTVFCLHLISEFKAWIQLNQIEDKMLSAMIKEHQIKQSEKRAEIDVKRNEAIVSSQELTSDLVNHLNDGVAKTYINQRKLDSEAKQLVQNVTQFEKSVNQWLQLMSSFNKAVKQLGDVQNWSKAIEHDMRTVSSALEYAYKSGNDNN